jgi:hypothetical protein
MNCNLKILIIWKLEIRKGFKTWIMYLMHRKGFLFSTKVLALFEWSTCMSSQEPPI